MSELLRKIESRDAQVAVIGIGYVGLPLSVAFAKAGFHTVGVDVDPIRVEGVNRGRSHIIDVPSQTLAELVASGLLRATGDYGVVADSDVVIICVSTPLSKTKDPDVSNIVAATEQVARYVQPGSLVVLESTSYPGTTEELVKPRLTEAGYQIGRDIFLAFSPERIDPGNRRYNIHNTPKVIGGVTPECLQVACALYAQVVDQVVPVSSTHTAEMVKLLENTFRAVNIALVNEIAMICDRLKVDVWEVIEAAATKPYGFMPFYPGPGLGGHCIPVDPHYLSWKLRTMDYEARFIHLAQDINFHMPSYWVEKIRDALNDKGMAVKGAKVLVLGVTYKKDVADIRESPALAIMDQLLKKGAIVSYHDPYVSVLRTDGHVLESLPDDQVYEALGKADCVVIATDHSWYDWERVAAGAATLVDTRNAVGRRRILPWPEGTAATPRGRTDGEAGG